ncbi:hypothetical protein ABPG77_010387 [Micractinium sp. CCAP 211/92]
MFRLDCDGSVVRDQTIVGQYTPVSGPICNSSSTVASGQYKGACLSMVIQYEFLQGQQADTKVGGADTTTVQQRCSCGYVTSLEVGFIVISDKSYASLMNTRCSNGQVIKDVTTTLPATWQTTPACVPGGKVVGGPNAGACRWFVVQYDTVQGFEGDTKVVNAGRAGTASFNRTCTNGVFTGMNFKRYVPSPSFNALNNVMNSLFPICGAPKACAPPPRPPPPKETAGGWGDPHFKDFNGLIFEFHGVPGNWYELLGSKLPDMSLKTQVQRSVRVPTHTYMRAFELRINTTVINIKLLPPLASKPEVWRIVATANGQPVVSSRTLPNGIKIDRVTGDIGKFGTVKVNAGFMFISAIQKWRPNLNKLADHLDINIILYNRLKLPVTGILAPSYTQAADPVSNNLLGNLSTILKH